METRAGRILIVDDEEVVHLTLKRLLEGGGYNIDSVYSGGEALKKLKEGYDLIICDIRMPDMDGIELLREIGKRQIDVEVIMLTGYASLETATQSLNYGARGYLMKPIEDISDFRVKVHEAVSVARLNRDNKQFYEAMIAGQLDSLMVGGKFQLVPDLREEGTGIFQRVINVVRDGVVLLDFDGNITFCNVHFAQMLGAEYQGLLGARFDSYITEEDKQKMMELITRLTDGQITVYAEVQLRTSFGNILSVVVSATPIYHEMQYRGIAMVISNTTEISKVRNKLELLAHLVENAQYDMIFITQPDGRIIECNALAKSTFGYSQSEILSLNINELVKSEKGGTIWSSIHGSIKRDSHWKGDIAAVCKDGRQFPAKLTVSSPEKAGRNTNMICFMRDITIEKEVDMMKSEFVSIASHELRTPLTSIKNAVGIILKKKAGEITEQQANFLSMAERNINRLSSLVDDLLDISKIEAGKLQLRCDGLDIKTSVENVFRTLGPTAEAKSLALRIHLPDELPGVYADSQRVEEVLLNLINNAIKFTPEGGTITVAAHGKEKASDTGVNSFLEVSVKDTGIGIPLDRMEHLFEKFYQVNSSMSRTQRGTGLGLAICKGIVEAHGGRIRCDSREGRGSTFTFTLPVVDEKARFYEDLENEISKVRDLDMPLSVLLIRVMDFSGYLGTCGKNELSEYVGMLKECVIKSGIRPTDRITALHSRGEVLLVMPQTGRGGGEVVRERAEQAISRDEIKVCDGRCPSVAAVVATYPEDGTSAEELVGCGRRNAEKDTGVDGIEKHKGVKP